MIDCIYKYSLILLSLISLVGGISYKIYSLNFIGIFLSIVLVAVLFIIILLLDKKINQDNANVNLTHPKIKKIELSQYIYNFLYLIFFILAILTLYKSNTNISIISPWDIVPNYFFIIYFLATITVIINIIQNKKNSLFLITFHYLLSFSVAVIVYKIYYGFDPFIHEAALKLIDQNGFVSPKPFYYLGQYSLIIILHKLTFIPIYFLNKFLVSFLAAIYLPYFSVQLLKKWFNDYRSILLTILFLLIFPFTIFIITTPQSFAYLFLFLIIILSLNIKNYFDLCVIALLSLVAFITQPIVGIPAIIFFIILVIYNLDNKKRKKYYYLFSYLIIIISLPLAFFLLEKNQSKTSEKISFLDNLSNVFILPEFSIPSEENFILNFIYLINNNLFALFILIISFGIYLFLKHQKECKIFSLFLYTSISLYISFILTKTLPFNFLIFYERSNYTDRILTISIIFLLPFILISIYNIITKILNQNKFIKLSLLLLFSILITTSLYLSYPRHDNFFNTRGYSTSKNDIKAVNWIEDNYKEDYIVLANQQVSAAALYEFGFKKYYKNDIFFYPIPTGAPLYQYYLTMVYESPSRETMIEAMNFAGVNESYFILNKYWWAFEKIKKEASLAADHIEEIDDGEIVIFKYIK
ncbi:hypothetical protein KAI92_04180 [Candidatus Parcubacteria bacterium]|nr:hypothetical protein [Candidatus Parcubacteria bacterium]